MKNFHKFLNEGKAEEDKINQLLDKGFEKLSPDDKKLLGFLSGGGNLKDFRNFDQDEPNLSGEKFNLNFYDNKILEIHAIGEYHDEISYFEPFKMISLSYTKGSVFGGDNCVEIEAKYDKDYDPLSCTWKEYEGGKIIKEHELSEKEFRETRTFIYMADPRVILRNVIRETKPNEFNIDKKGFITVENEISKEVFYFEENGNFERRLFMNRGEKFNEVKGQYKKHEIKKIKNISSDKINTPTEIKKPVSTPVDFTQNEIQDLEEDMFLLKSDNVLEYKDQMGYMRITKTLENGYRFEMSLMGQKRLDQNFENMQDGRNEFERVLRKFGRDMGFNDPD